MFPERAMRDGFMHDLAKRVEEILKNAYAASGSPETAAREYSESFQKEGLRKAKFVIDRINEFDKQTAEQLQNFIALSVGGADGSDLLALVRQTPIKHVILLEHDNSSAKKAEIEIAPQIEDLGGTLDVIIGDAVQQLEPLVEILTDAKQAGTGGLLCLLFAVIHELPRRSPGFELHQYIARLTSVFESNCFFLSEPYLPIQNETNIELKVASIHEDRLYELLNHVNAHLFNNGHLIQKMSKGFVRVGFQLAMETLHKLLRYDSIPRFRYEMEERLTQFTSPELMNALRVNLPRAIVECTERVSEGFLEAYLSSQVELRTVDGISMVMPFSHVRISAISIPRRIDRMGDKVGVFQYADSSLADIDFPMPAGKVVTEIVDAMRTHNWPKQRKAVDRVFESLEWDKLTSDEAFVIGRNIYQCAEGGETQAKKVMTDLRREFAKIPGDWSLHVLNGMFFEAYFDAYGRFRGNKIKSKYLANLFEVETNKKFETCIEFIRAKLMPYRERLGVLPGVNPEYLQASVILNFGVDPPILESIKCLGDEQVIPADDDSDEIGISGRTINIESFKEKLSSFWKVPIEKIALRGQGLEQLKRLRIESGKSIKRLGG